MLEVLLSTDVLQSIALVLIAITLFFNGLTIRSILRILEKIKDRQ